MRLTANTLSPDVDPSSDVVHLCSDESLIVTKKKIMSNVPTFVKSVGLFLIKHLVYLHENKTTFVKAFPLY